MADRVDAVRVDVWLWAVRIFRTRTQATAACNSGKVSINGTTAKPAKAVRPGDKVTARAAGRERILEVVETPSKRLGAPLASAALVDHSPPPPTPKRIVRNAPPAQREPGTGRPTIRDRRQMERFRGTQQD